MAIQQPPVSVIICARNEKTNLEKNLIHLLSQKYPKYEVIVVNDFSNDGSDDYLMDMSKKYPQLYHTNITIEARVLNGKKFALTIGMKAAQYDYVLLTDADCAPKSDMWLAKMMEGYTDGKDIVLGYAPYQQQNGLLNKIIRFETFYTGMQYLGYALNGLPYMGVGRNLSYKRQVFFDYNNIFVKHPKLISGDDDLLINKAANSKNTSIEIRPDSFVYSNPKRTWEEWWYQKVRHLGTARYYKPGHKFMLSIFSMLHVLFYFSLIASLLYTHEYALAASIWVGRIVINSSVSYAVMRKLREDDLIVFYPFFDLALFIYYIIFTPAAIARKPAKRWK